MSLVDTVDTSGDFGDRSGDFGDRTGDFGVAWQLLVCI